MTKLTGTFSEVAEYAFTTLTTVPGTLTVHGAPSKPRFMIRMENIVELS
jgi:ribosome-interacting GTPase 1